MKVMVGFVSGLVLHCLLQVQAGSWGDSEVRHRRLRQGRDAGRRSPLCALGSMIVSAGRPAETSDGYMGP